MYKAHSDKIEPGDNVIIGLGDSFTQGVGAYSLETWKSIPSEPWRYNISGQKFLDEQAKNNWVRQICDKHLPGYKVWNLGVNGSGNRATVREMYLNPLPENLGNVVVIMLATGIERYDFIKQSDETAGLDWHQKWQTIFPNLSDRGAISILETEYLKQIWSMRNDALEFLFTVREAQNFCDSKGYKFLFTSLFDPHINRDKLKMDLGIRHEHVDMVDWNNYITIPNRESMMDMVNQLEFPYRTIHDIHTYHAKTTLPSKYITPCSHWSIEGQELVADFLFNELTDRKLV